MSATHCTQADFARLNAWSKSYVTKLKGEGRLVLTADGLVDVAASLQRIRGTTGAPERASPPAVSPAYGDATERDRFYAAELKRLDYERAVRGSLSATDVVAAVTDAATRLRAALESWPDRLAPQLAAVGADEARIRALLAEEVEHRLAELARGFDLAAAPAECAPHG